MDFQEINRLIGTEVMEWEYRESLDSWVDNLGKGAYVVADGNFSPSNNIQHAWQVINKMQKEWSWEMVMINEAREVDVRIGKGVYTSKSVPLAICMAALKAVGFDTSVQIGSH